MAWSLSFLSLINDAGWSFFKHRLSGAAIRANLGTNRRNTLYDARKKRNFLRLVGNWSPWMASVVWKRCVPSAFGSLRDTCSQCCPYWTCTSPIWVWPLPFAIQRRLRINGRCVAASFRWIRLYRRGYGGQISVSVLPWTRSRSWYVGTCGVHCKVRMAYLQINKDQYWMWMQFCLCLHHQSWFGNIRYELLMSKWRSLCQARLCALTCMISGKSPTWYLHYILDSRRKVREFCHSWGRVLSVQSVSFLLSQWYLQRAFYQTQPFQIRSFLDEAAKVSSVQAQCLVVVARCGVSPFRCDQFDRLTSIRIATACQ